MVIQYDITNTLPDVILANVSVLATPSEEDEALEEEFSIPASKIASDPATVFVSYSKVGNVPYPVTTFTNILKLLVFPSFPKTSDRY